MPLVDPYDALPGVRWSNLRAIGKSPAHYHARINGHKPDTKSLDLGRLVHLAVLEPETFSRRVLVYPGKKRQGKAWEGFQAAHLNDAIVTRADYDTAKRIADAVWSHRLARELISDAERERVVQRELDGVLCKAKIDAIGMGGMVDLKTGRDVGPGGWPYVVRRYEYHGQAAFYSRVEEWAGPCFNIAVESSEPHDVVVFRLATNTMAEGCQIVDEYLGVLRTCLERNEWPGQADDVVTLTMPGADPLDLDWSEDDDDDE